MNETKRCPNCHKERTCINTGQKEEIVTSALDKKLAILTSYYTCSHCKEDFEIYKTYSLNYEFTKTVFKPKEKRR